MTFNGVYNKLKEDTQATKVCSKCGKSPATKTRSWCKDCIKQYDKSRYNENPEQVMQRTKEYYHDNIDKSLKDAMWRKMRLRYGLTKEGFDELLNDQSGRCAVCNKPLDEHLHVDHCHKTNKVRGLVCGKCNNSISVVEQSNDMNEDLKKAIIEYLKGA